MNPRTNGKGWLGGSPATQLGQSVLSPRKESCLGRWCGGRRTPTDPLPVGGGQPPQAVPYRPAPLHRVSFPGPPSSRTEGPSLSRLSSRQALPGPPDGMLHTSCGSPHYACPEIVKGEVCQRPLGCGEGVHSSSRVCVSFKSSTNSAPVDLPFCNASTNNLPRMTPKFSY